MFVGLCALGASLVLSVPAVAGVTHKPTGVTFGPFLAPGDVTVVQSSGDVLVVDGGAQRVERFTSAGVPANFSALGTNVIDGHETPQSSFELAGPGQSQVAVDESAGATKGEIYVTDSNHHVVDIFAPDGHYLGQLTGTHSTPFGTVCGVAVDQAGNVLVADENGQIHRFQAFTNPVTNSDWIGDIPVSSACELALDSTGDIFATQPFGGPVNKYDSAGDLQYALGSSNATGVAVDPASGDVYVAGESSVVQFDASSSIAPVELGSFGPGTVTSPAGVAVDGATGEVFVSDGAAQDVVVFGAGVATPDATTGAASGVSDTKATVEGGVNPEGTATQWQFEYGTETSYGSTAPASPQSAGNGTSEVPVSTELSGLAAGTTYHYRLVAIGANGTTYGADETFTTQAPPSVDSQSVEPIAKTTATLDAQVNPWGAETTYHFEYGPTESYGTSTGDKTLAAGWGDQGASAEISGLTAGATYHYRVVASNSVGGPVDGPDQTFTAVSAASFEDAQETEAIYADKVTSSAATLHAEVNPLGDATTYHFEYGPTEAYGTSIPVPDGNLGAGNRPVAVSQSISGLAAGTVFHFRVVATNVHGTVMSKDSTFKTLSAPLAGENCPNAQIRAEQKVTYLPDCRAYEKVSPEEKGHGDIIADGETSIAATGGGAVAFSSRTPFGDEVASGLSGQTQYVARRNQNGTGWVTHAVTPESQPEAYQTFYTATKVQIFSDDLTTALVWGYDLPGVETPSPPRNYIYAEDVATRALQPLTVSQDQTLGFREFVNVEDLGISADARHVAFVTPTQMLSTARAGASNVYQSDNGVLSLAGILPDGSIPQLGSEPAAKEYRGSMSANGSRLLFTAVPQEENPQPQLYMRIDGKRTVWISEPEGSDKSEPVEVHLQYMTPDGNNVFFVTNSKLLDEDKNEGPDLYRWTYGPDPEHEKNLTLITSAGGFALLGVKTGVIGASDDGSRVYYVTPDGHVSVWDNGTTRLITSDASPDLTVAYSLTAMASRPALGRVSPDGMWLAFMSLKTLGNDHVHGLTGQITNQHYEMYLYNLKSETLTCVSCSSIPATGDASVLPGATKGDPELFDDGIRPQFLTENGKVFFSTPESLLPQDSNGVADVYEYDGETGQLSLLSPGTGGDPTTFADASADGGDVFVQTRRQLLPEDRDSLVDMYDVRSDGGFPEAASVPAPCVADECQPQSPAVPGFGAPASVGFSGAGNLPGVTGKPAAKSPSNAHKLAAALRVCKRKRVRAHRKKCEAQARKRYAKQARNAGGSK